MRCLLTSHKSGRLITPHSQAAQSVTEIHAAVDRRKSCLLRRAHLRAPRQPGRVGARQLDWQYRPDHLQHLPGLEAGGCRLVRADRRLCAAAFVFRSRVVDITSAFCNPLHASRSEGSGRSVRESRTRELWCVWTVSVELSPPRAAGRWRLVAGGAGAGGATVMGKVYAII